MEPTNTPEVSAEGDAHDADGSELAKAGGRRHSTTLVILVSLAALAVGGAVGAVAGWQFEQGRAEADIKNIRPVGTVIAVTDDSVRVRLRTTSGEREYKLSESTVVETAAQSDTDEIVEGATVLVRSRNSSDGPEAREIVILPDSSTWSRSRGAE